MADETVTIEGLDPTNLPSLLHFVPAMKDGLTVKLTIAQLRAVMLSGNDDVALALKDLSNTVGPRGKFSPAMPNSTDYDTLLENGLWAIALGAPNAPEATRAYIVHNEVSPDASYVTQTARGYAADSSAEGYVYRRERNANVWGSWYRVRENEAELDARYARLAIGSYRLKKVTRYSSSGSHTMDVATRLAIVKAQGSGGGGGGAGGAGSGTSAGGGGGAGAYLERWLTAGWGTPTTVTIGAGGSGGSSSGGGGSVGGDVSFGTLLVAKGGNNGGGSASRSTGPVRGQNGGGLQTGSTMTGGTSLLDIHLVGGAGWTGQSWGTTAVGGKGSDAPSGGAGARENTEGSGGNDAGGPGGGGGGAAESSSTGRAGGSGAAGFVIVEEYE